MDCLKINTHGVIHSKSFPDALSEAAISDCVICYNLVCDVFRVNWLEILLAANCFELESSMSNIDRFTGA